LAHRYLLLSCTYNAAMKKMIPTLLSSQRNFFVFSIACLLGLLPLTTYAQNYYAPMQAPQGANHTEVKLPIQVEVEFKLAYPKAIDVYWECEYGTTYTASFIDTTVMNITYDTNGNLQYTEAQMTANQLSATITANVNKRYAGWQIMNARAITDAKKALSFNVLIQKEDKPNSYDLTYDQQGNFICSSPPLPKIVQ